MRGRTERLLGGALAAFCAAVPAHAYLGGFEQQDGYHYGAPVGFFQGDNDVTRYNAGEFGTNNGGPGGGPMLITPDSGLWRVVTGGRLLNQQQDYYVVRHPAPPGHSSAQVLGMTTGNTVFSGGVDTLYRYRFDARDFNGAAPSSLAGSVVTVQFDWCPENAFTSPFNDPGSTIQFIDSTGAIRFELGSFGLTESITYRVNGGAWTAAGFDASGTDFDRITLRFDTANDTVSFDYLRTASATPYSVLAGAALGGNMDYLSEMGLFMKAGNAKNYLDDFSFRVGRPSAAVPEPGTVALLGLVLVAFLGRRARIVRSIRPGNCA